MVCPRCGETMKVVAFIEPPQQVVIYGILQHNGLLTERPPPTFDTGLTLDSVEGQPDEQGYDPNLEYIYVDLATFEVEF